MKTNRIFITATSPHAAFCASRRTSSSGRGLCKNPVICVKPKMPPNPLTVILDLGLTGSIRPSHAPYFAHAAYGLLSLNSNPIVDRATGAQVTIHAARSRPDRDLSRDANIVAFIGPIIPGRLNTATETPETSRKPGRKPKVQYPPRDPFAQTTSKHSMKTVIFSHLGLASLCAKRIGIPASANLSSKGGTRLEFRLAQSRNV